MTKLNSKYKYFYDSILIHFYPILIFSASSAHIYPSGALGLSLPS